MQAAGLEDWIRAIDAPSQEAVKQWDGPIRLLFIDGDHSYEGCRRDFELWSPFVVPGGIIAFHDVGYFEGSTQFYQELMGANQEYTELFTLSHLAVTQRKLPG